MREDVFWSECQKYMQEIIGLAVDNRCHGIVTHFAQAISAKDLLDDVKSKCPEGTCIPSVSWLTLQFWAKACTTKASCITQVNLMSST